MLADLSFLSQVLSARSEVVLQQAYKASQNIRSIQIEYIQYNTTKKKSKHSLEHVVLYMHNALNKYTWEIHSSLIQLNVNIIILTLMNNLGFYVKSTYWLFVYTDNSHIFEPFERNSSYIQLNSQINEIANLSYFGYISSALAQIFNKTHIKSLPCSFSYLEATKAKQIRRKLIWIEAALIDVEFLKKQCSLPSLTVNENINILNSIYFIPIIKSKPKPLVYESIGLVPRSITRTLSRFKTELAGDHFSLVLPEFRLAKYQAIASIQYIICLLFIPWLNSFLCKKFILEPLIQHWWNMTQSQVFLSFSQEEKALKRLQEVEELLWLDSLIVEVSKKQPQDFKEQVHKKTFSLVETYNQESIHTITHLFADFVSLITLVCLLTLGRKRLAIFNSWIQEIFYSLSDTMKAFFILLFTDLCVGFHSPHGWEVLMELLLEHLGFSHNRHIVSCFVSTFPVILDTVFKYWIFRHLNRISPSIVVSYHAMNE